MKQHVGSRSRNRRYSGQKNLLKGPILSQMMSLTWPTMGGLLGIVLFNITDTYFVSQLGTDALGAMGFTFPVITTIGSASLGVSLGAGSVLSRAMGEGDTYHMKRTATDGILLSMIFVLLVSIVGIATLDPLFRLMGAEGEALRLVKQYMFIWYMGAVTVMMPPVSDSCLRATGDMVRPFVVMMVCAGVNLILDPIFIFGYFGVPPMGIQGAAIATLIARTCGMVTTLYFLHHHAGLLDLSKPSFSVVRDSWKRILHVGVPAAMTQLLPPLSRALLTRLAATVAGVAGVAAFAAGSRVESLSTIFMASFAMALVPMVGQNWGAKQLDRIHNVRKLSLRLAIICGVLGSTLFFLCAQPIAEIFSHDPIVIRYTVIYLRVTALGLGGLSYLTWINQSCNAVGKPVASARINLITYLLCMIPLAYTGAYIFGFTGIIIAIAVSQTLGALWAYYEGIKVFSV